MIEQVHFYDVTPGDVHIDAPMSNILLAYRPNGFIADQILPVVGVNKQSDLIPMYRAGDNQRIEKDERAPGTLPRYISMEVTSKTYFAVNRALGTFLTSEEVANDDAWDVANGKAYLVWDVLMVGYEYRVAATVTNSANVGGGTNTGSSWADWSTPNALQNVITDIATCEDQGGYPVTQVTFGKTAWRNFRNNDSVKGVLFPHGGGIPSTQQVANLLGVQKVLVGGVYYNSAAEGASQALGKIWDAHVVYQHQPASPTRWTPAHGYAFRWNVPGMPNLTVRRFPFDEKRGRQDIHIGYYQDEKILDTNMAYCRWHTNSSS